MPRGVPSDSVHGQKNRSSSIVDRQSIDRSLAHAPFPIPQFYLVDGASYAPGCCGLGSLVHRLTAGLAVAMNAGRVLVYNASQYGVGARLSSGPFCASVAAAASATAARGGRGAAPGSTEAYPGAGSGLGCYLLPLSVCVPSPGSDVLPLEAASPESRAALPDAVRNSLEASGLPLGRQLLWWRTHAAPYVMRLNGPTAELLARRRRALARAGLVPHPLPKGTVRCEGGEAA